MEDISKAPWLWVSKMTHWLPYHRDRYFLGLQAAMQGCYRPQFEASQDPETVRADAEADFERRMAEMHRKAEPLLRAIQPRRQRGR